MLLTSISFRSQPHKRGEVVSVVDDLVNRMRHAHGCLRSRFLDEVEDDNAFTVIAEWESVPDAEAFFGSREFQILKGIRILMRGEPVIVFDDVQTRATRLIRGA
jgi:quinol monooxygenase YgiN